jgi:predicted nucleotidyltransferase
VNAYDFRIYYMDRIFLDSEKYKVKFVRKLELLAKKYGITLIVLFGSSAKGITRQNTNSDIDLAVSLDKPISEAQEGQLFIDLINILRTDSLDLINLDYASP